MQLLHTEIITAVNMPHLFPGCLITKLFSVSMLFFEKGLVSGMCLAGLGEEWTVCVSTDKMFSLSSLTLYTVAFSNKCSSMG